MILGVFAVAFALTANVAFAHSYNFGNPCCFPHKQPCCPEVNVSTGNFASIVNNITSKASTGWNSIIGQGSATISTGAAIANSGAGTQANLNQITVIQPTSGKVNVSTSNTASVTNMLSSYAKTGGNSINMCECGSQIQCGRRGCHNPCPCPTASITTGNAGAYSTATTLVNSNVITIR